MALVGAAAYAEDCGDRGDMAWLDVGSGNHAAMDETSMNIHEPCGQLTCDRAMRHFLALDFPTWR